MSGNSTGGKLAAETNKREHGEDFYSRIGQIGGKVKTDKPKGFAYLKANGMLDKIKEAGALGGKNSRGQKNG